MIKSFIFASTGIITCWKGERNFRVHVLLAIIAIACGVYFRISTSEWTAVLLCIAFVLCLEIMNTAVEKLSDMVTTSIHPMIKKIKDMSAAAVLVAAIISFIIGCLIFLPKFYLLFK